MRLQQGNREGTILEGVIKNNDGIIILGIDPGTVALGYGLIRQLNAHYEYIDSGVIKVAGRKSLPERLCLIHRGLEELIDKYRPHVAVIEKIFFAGGVRATLGLGYSRGVALLAVAQHEIPVYEYSTLEVKKAITGYGKADKDQVSEMVRRILSLNTRPLSDSADALALCICHAHNIMVRLR